MSIDEQIRAAVRAELSAFEERMEKLIRSGASPSDELLTVAEAAKLAKVKPATVRRWVREGHLTAKGRARGMRVSRQQVLTMEAPTKAAPQKAESPRAKASRLLGGN